MQQAEPCAGLTLLGVGPGDPQLLTVAAVRAIEAATVVAYPVAREGGIGMAATIAAPWIGHQQRQLPLVFPMVAEAEPRRLAWRVAAAALAAEVAAGHAVVLLCEGDASLFASCSYVLLALAAWHPGCPVRVIPGISSVAAAAAAASELGGPAAPAMPWPLALQGEGLLIRPTPESPAELEALLDWAAAGSGCAAAPAGPPLGLGAAVACNAGPARCGPVCTAGGLARAAAGSGRCRAGRGAALFLVVADSSGLACRAALERLLLLLRRGQ